MNTGELTFWAERLVERFDSYWEVTPSGTGVRIWTRGHWPGKESFTLSRPLSQKIEVFGAQGYVTVTGQHLPSTPLTIVDCSNTLESLRVELLVLDQAFREDSRLRSLWLEGAAGDASSNDLSLVSRLSRYTNDTRILDEIFRMSALSRPKWDERHRSDGSTYGQMTIEAALRRPREETEPELDLLASLRPQPIGEIAAAVRGQERHWLIESLWLEGTYGGVGAQWKAGKTWWILDEIVSIASGTSFLGRFPCRPGPVLLFLGEGDQHETVRRLDAICLARSIQLDSLPISVAFRVPTLNAPAHLKVLEGIVQEKHPVLVALDPLYLAQGGITGSNLAEMGALLVGPQIICQRAGASLQVMAHWNQTGTGTGFERVTGAGIQEWSRTMVSMEILESYRAPLDDPKGETRVKLNVLFGGQVETEFVFERRVWTENRLDPNSPMHYETRVLGESKEDHRRGDESERLMFMAQTMRNWVRQQPGITILRLNEKIGGDKGLHVRARRLAMERKWIYEKQAGSQGRGLFPVQEDP